jgi:hypothetical protein
LEAKGTNHNEQPRTFMASSKNTAKTQQTSAALHASMALDVEAREAAKHSLKDGAVTPHYATWREDINSADLPPMIRANLVAERVAVEAYSQTITMTGDKDATTQRLIEGTLSEEQKHAEELEDWLAA